MGVKNTYAQIHQGTGELLIYDDPFAAVTPELQEEAAKVKAVIIGEVGELQKSYLKLGYALDMFDTNKLYLADQADSFRQWLKDNANLGIDYRTAHDLIRIVREAIPILMEHDLMDMLPTVSKMRALLPTLADGEDMFLAAVEQIQGKTVAQTYEIIDELRGVDPKDKAGRKPFRAVVNLGDKQHSVKIVSTNPENSYTLGFLSVEKSEWAAFEKAFGGMVEVNLSPAKTKGDFKPR